jgi:hypothetical protein
MEGLFRGTWYRSAVKLEGDTIIPVPPFEPYNPFDWYYSASEVRQGQRSLYLEFLAVNSDKTEEVVNFCKRFGVLGANNPSTLSPSDRFHLIAAEFFKLISKETRKDFELKGLKPRDWDRLNRELGRHLAKTENLEEVLEPLKTLTADSAKASPSEICLPMAIGDFALSQCHLKRELSRKHDHANAMLEINQLLFWAHVRPYLHWDIQRGRAALGWESQSLEGILWLMAALDFLGPGNILTCPRCNTFFFTESNRVKYCSPPCYQNYKVQKYQKKKKEEKMAAQRSKKTKTTKSTGKKK